MRDLVIDLAAIEPGSGLAAAVSKRADIFALTQATHDAAITPIDPGGLSHGLRAALACRIARINGDPGLARHFLDVAGKAGASDAERRVAELDFAGDDLRTSALVRHADLVARDPKSATGKDIAALRESGVPDADIVRLSELVAFVSYQIRLVAGLRLMQAAS
jgi:uncharacterized protein YciW